MCKLFAVHRTILLMHVLVALYIAVKRNFGRERSPLRHMFCVNGRGPYDGRYSERIRYISTEHPAVTYYNPKYISYANLTSQRYGRHDPFYYVGFHAYFIYQFHNNLSIHFYFYEFLSNTYRRGFVEMHLRFCDFVHKDKFFGSAVKQGNLDRPCPFPAGNYHLYNMTIPVKEIPRSFPFTKGRIYCNLTATATDELIASGHINMEIKEAHIRKKDK